MHTIRIGKKLNDNQTIWLSGCRFWWDHDEGHETYLQEYARASVLAGDETGWSTGHVGEPQGGAGGQLHVRLSHVPAPLCHALYLQRSKYRFNNKTIEDAFTTFEIQSWLPDFMLGINPFWIFCAWPVWVEVAHYIGNKIVISSLSIDGQFKIQ